MMNEETALLDPIFPGEILFEEFIRPLGIHIKTLSDELSISEPKYKGHHTR
jgi:plasmid maintenance system antidote protein VapI